MRRHEIAMTDEEMDGFLHENHVMHVATRHADGMPHLVTMWYTFLRGNLAFWSYGRAQKIVNLRRDPRLACLIEAGHLPWEVRGVEIEGTATILDDPDDVLAVGREVYRRGSGIHADESLLARMGAAKRVAVVVHPQRIASWDHRKISGGYLGEALS